MSSLCPSCDRALPSDSPSGLCPYCLLAPSTAADESWSQTGFVPPRPSELQLHFAAEQLRIVRLLGRGGMGAVYQARQPQLDREVAVKILPPELSARPGFDERFEREAQVLAKLDHANIVDVYEFGKAGPFGYLVMEYVDGANLRELLLESQITPGEALQIVPQVCDALQFAHDQGIVHRDIKPENILIDPQGRVKIMDFGLAKLAGSQPSQRQLTATRQLMGTYHYMAPEQIECARDVDHRADIFALGVVFYEMLTGELPLGRFDPPSAKLGRSELDPVVMRSLEKSPDRRYAQATEMRSDVDRVNVDQFAQPPRKPPILRHQTEDELVASWGPVAEKCWAAVRRFAAHPLLTIERLTGSLRLMQCLTLLFYAVIIGGLMLLADAHSDDDVFFLSITSGAALFLISTWGAMVYPRVRAGVLLRFYSVPLRLLGKPWRIVSLVKRAVRRMTRTSHDHAPAVQFPEDKAARRASKGRLGIVGWWSLVFFAIAIGCFIGGLTDDDFVPGFFACGAIAGVLARSALFLARPPRMRQKVLLFPPLLTALLPFLVFVIAFPGVFTLIASYETRLTGMPRRSSLNWTICLYLATMVGCFWWSLLCWSASTFPGVAQAVLYPIAPSRAWLQSDKPLRWGLALCGMTAGIGTLIMLG